MCPNKVWPNKVWPNKVWSNKVWSNKVWPNKVWPNKEVGIMTHNDLSTMTTSSLKFSSRITHYV